MRKGATPSASNASPPASGSKASETGRTIAETTIMPGQTDNSVISKFLPATIIPDESLSDDRLETWAHQTVDVWRVRCERTEEGHLRLFAPAAEQIWLMVKKVHTDLLKWVTESSSTGRVAVNRRFFFQDGSMMCPDIAYAVRKNGGDPFDTEPRDVLKVCPDFVIEFCSHPRQLRPMKDKMLRWMANGAKRAWLMVPQEECVFMYSPGAEPSVIDGDLIVGNGPVEGFYLFLPEVWRFDVYRRLY